MIDFDSIIAEKVTEYNLDNSRRILVIDDSGTGKASALSNFINQNKHITKTCIYVKGPYKTIYKYIKINR